MELFDSMRARFSFIGPRCCISCGSTTAMRLCMSRGRPLTSRRGGSCSRARRCERRSARRTRRRVRAASLRSGDPEAAYALAPMLAFLRPSAGRAAFSGTRRGRQLLFVPCARSRIRSGRGAQRSRVPANSHQSHRLPGIGFAAWSKPTTVHSTSEARAGPGTSAGTCCRYRWYGSPDALHEVRLPRNAWPERCSRSCPLKTANDRRSSSGRPRRSTAIPHTADGARSCRGTV